MVVFLTVVDAVWLCYHIFLVISMDWIFYDKGGVTEEEEIQDGNASMGMNVYVNRKEALGTETETEME